MNKNIQLCSELVGIDYEITLTRYIGATRHERKFKKYELITSHVARKTFVTNSIILGINERIVREITHHKDEKSFKRYLKIPKSLKQNELSKWNLASKYSQDDK